MADDPLALYQQSQVDSIKKQMLAQLLMQNSKQPEGQMVGRYYVAPSPLSRLSSLGSELLGAKTTADVAASNINAKNQLYAAMLGGGGQTSQQDNSSVPYNLRRDDSATPAQPSVQPQSGLQSPPGVNPQAWRLMVAGGTTNDPFLLKAGEITQEANKPMNLRPGGSVVQFGPDGKPQSTFVAPQITEITDASGRKISGYATPQGFQPFNISGSTNPPSSAPKGNKSDPWNAMPKLQLPTGMGETTYGKAISQQAGEKAAALSEKYGQQADIANQRQAINNQALELLDKATTGPGAMAITGVKNFLSSRLGISEDVLNKVSSGDVSATQALNKDLLNAATQMAKSTYGSRMTQSEVMLQIKQGAPNVDMTAATIKYLLNTDNVRTNYQIKQSQDLGRYLNGGGDPLRFEGWYAANFPLTKEFEGVALHPKAGVNPQNKTVHWNDLK